MFTRNRAKLEAMLKTYWRSGGAQAMLTVVNRGDLEAAMRDPEQWGHIMVRIGGFSERFTNLSQEVQRHILERTLNEKMFRRFRGCYRHGVRPPAGVSS